MIIATHNNHIVLSYLKDDIIYKKYNGLDLYHFFLKVSNEYPDDILIWVHKNLKCDLNIENLNDIFHHKRIMASYSQEQYLSDALGYVDQRPFINVNLEVKYPTWRMHKAVGGIHTSIINLFINYLKEPKNFDEFLHSLAYIGHKKGLFCYSEPDLLIKNDILKRQIPSQASDYDLFRFVALHYSNYWKHLLFLCRIIYERKFPLLPWLKSCFIKKTKIPNNLIEKIEFPEIKKQKDFNFELDVIIPTIGRKKYLYDVLKDLSNQTIIPKNVIVIEQNPDDKSESELDYLYKESWPFLIKHKFIHQTGACNARNIGLDLVESKWVFLADDDIRLNKHITKKVFEYSINLRLNCITTNCLQKNEPITYKKIIQWSRFGAGNTFINYEKIKNIRFHKGLEHGYGEDIDFGNRLRNNGVDIILIPDIKILHLKAPVGGFRQKKKLLWQNDRPLPKPSPTVLLSKLMHYNQKQIFGYKTVLFLKTLSKKGYLYIFHHYFYFHSAWRSSMYWATKLKEKQS